MYQQQDEAGAASTPSRHGLPFITNTPPSAIQKRGGRAHDGQGIGCGTGVVPLRAMRGGMRFAPFCLPCSAGQKCTIVTRVSMKSTTKPTRGMITCTGLSGAFSAVRPCAGCR